MMNRINKKKLKFKITYELKYNKTTKNWNVWKNLEINASDVGSMNSKTLFTGTKKACQEFIKINKLKLIK